MRLQWFGFEFGMELAANKMWMVGQFHHLDVSPIRSRTGNSQTSRGQRAFVFPVEFVTMAMPFADFQLTINFVRQSTGLDFARPGAQPHGSAQLFHAA